MCNKKDMCVYVYKICFIFLQVWWYKLNSDRYLPEDTCCPIPFNMSGIHVSEAHSMCNFTQTSMSSFLTSLAARPV